MPARAQASTRLEGRIQVSYGGQKGTYSFEGGAVHQFWADPAEKDTLGFGDRTVLRGRVSHVAAYLRSVGHGDDGSENSKQEGNLTFQCPGAGGDQAWLCAPGAVSMFVEAKERTYGFTFNSIAVPCVRTDGNDVFQESATIPGFHVGPLPLPDPGSRFSGSLTIPYFALKGEGIERANSKKTRPRDFGNAQLGYDWDENDPGPLITVSWDIGPPQLLEVQLEPEDYENWMPEGNLGDVALPGNDITIKATLRRKDDPSAAVDKKVRITFTLEKVSSEPGSCMNWPPYGAVAAKGLRFIQSANPEFTVAGPDQAELKTPAKTATIKVSAFDFGGWGRLRAKAVTEDGAEVPVKFKEETDPSIPLPLYRDNDHIAIAWLKEMGQLGKSPDADDDAEPVGNGSNGDGLTLYEEYRGFSVQGNHVRTDPRRKDLFICDRTGGWATSGIGLFQNSSNLEVHLLDNTELGDDRVINKNRGVGPHVVDQHGILIIQGPAGSSPQAVGSWGPPKTTRHIQIPPGGAYAPAPGNDQAHSDITADIAHELGHTVDLKHHGDGSLHAVLYTWKETAPGVWQMLEQGVSGDSDSASGAIAPKGAGTPVHLLREADGSEWRHGTAAPAGFAWSAGLQGYLTYAVSKNGECSGDDACVMRYGDKGVYYAEGDPAVRYIPDPAQWKPRTTLCGDGQGAGVNAAGHKPQSRYGDAQANHGNCQGQMLVSDRYAPQ
jgi:hypothetical protein